MWRQLFQKKSVELLLAEMAGEHRLERVLGPVALTALGLGAIIGAGIFVTTGRAAAIDAGPAIVVSYGIAALGCCLAALCYAEFAAMVPVSGSAYTYAYASLGELCAWIIGWDLILEYAMSCATVAAAWSEYLNEFLRAVGLPAVPARWCYDPFTEVEGGRAFFNLPAVVILLLVTILLVRGIRQSATTNAVMVVIKLAVVVFVIALGWWYVEPANWFDIPTTDRLAADDPASKWGLLGMLGIDSWLVPIDEATRSNYTPYGFSGIMLGGSIVFFAFIGFDAISTHAEEARRPQRDVPIGIFASLILCTVLYIGVAAVITGMVPYPQIDLKAPVAAAFSQRAIEDESSLLRGAGGLISLGALAGMSSVLLVTFLSQARIFMAMSRDGLLPKIFRTVHPQWRTPHLATMLVGAIICFVAAVTPITKLEEMVNIGTLLAFVVVCGAVLVLRTSRPDAHRPFRCPMLFVIAPCGVLVNVTMMLFLPWDTWLRLFVWLALGLVVYFLYGRHHSTLGRNLWQELATQGTSPTDAPLDTDGGG